MTKSVLALLLVCLAFTGAGAEPPIKRYLYMTSPDAAQKGNDFSGILVFDIDQGHRFVRRIEVPKFKEGLRGFCGNAKRHAAYYTTTSRRLGCFDLETEKVLWERSYEAGCDRASITPDGSKIYIPTGWWYRGDNSGFLEISAENGDVLDRLPAGPQAHNSIVSLDGQFVYLGTETNLWVFRTRDHTIAAHLDDVGEFGVFPFTVDSQNRLAYVCLGRHVGFDVVDLRANRVLRRVFAGETPIAHRTHGAALTPDEKELWISDQEGKRLFIFDPGQTASKPLGEVGLSAGGHGWISFSLDGRWAWCHTPDVIDTATRKVAATLKDENGTPVAGSKFIEVHLREGKVVTVGDQFGLGRARRASAASDAPGKGAGVARLAAGPAASLNETLEPLREKFKLPSLAAAVIRSNSLLAIGVVGVRKSGATNQVSAGDKFHIGSCTKSMTATLAAILVEQGTIRWTSTLGDIFPELKGAMDPLYREATLEQFLAHRGGAPADLEDGGLWGRIWQQIAKPPPEQRLFLLRGVTAKHPAAPPGTQYLYSNAGYAIAGAMLEKASHRPWEQLIREKLFNPLGLNSAGFGPPAQPGQIDQPWGHLWQDGKLKPVAPGPAADNPPAIAPAGTVHCSIYDLAQYAAFHLRGEAGRESLLRPESFRKLHHPSTGQEYALGWLVVGRPWAGGDALTHAGSNTMFYTVIWLAPNRDFGVVVATNVGGDSAARGCDQAASELIQHFLKTS